MHNYIGSLTLICCLCSKQLSYLIYLWSIYSIHARQSYCNAKFYFVCNIATFHIKNSQMCVYHILVLYASISMIIQWYLTNICIYLIYCIHMLIMLKLQCWYHIKLQWWYHIKWYNNNIMIIMMISYQMISYQMMMWFKHNFIDFPTSYTNLYIGTSLKHIHVCTCVAGWTCQGHELGRHCQLVL
jgi:hypothetical protein